ncbi:MAG: MerR family transcriptional regulator [Actinobacteria bacterium]|nr:MerR family transcriptional regulator [Actinomycetota bacterium]
MNISALAERTGVAPDTLRKWELRYGALSPERTSGGQRRYDSSDVARVKWLLDRLSDGYRIGQAASLLHRDFVPPRGPRALQRAILDAAEESDAAAIEALLDHAFAQPRVEVTFEKAIRPALVEVGDRWEAGTLSIGQEHLVSNAVRIRLERLLADSRPAVRGKVVLACAPEERHELGLLSLGLFLAGDGWRVIYLGASTPVRDAVEVAEINQAGLLGLSVSMPQHIKRLSAGLGPPARRGFSAVLGGRAASRGLASLLGAGYVGDDNRRAVVSLRKHGA